MDTIYITKLKTGTSDVVLIPNREVKKLNLGDRCKYSLLIACGVKSEASLPILISVDSANIPLLDRFGNEVYSNQLRSNKRYTIGYGNNNMLYPDGQFILYNELCCACKSDGFFRSRLNELLETKKYNRKEKEADK